MNEIIGKLKSDRLWAMLAYVCALGANVQMDSPIPAEQMTELMWVVLAFIGSKGLRGTTAGNMLTAIVSQVAAKQAGEPVTEPGVKESLPGDDTAP